MDTFLNLVVLGGRLIQHLRGAWRCTCEIAVVVNASIGEPEGPPDLGL